jgi:3D (Asp-Asp-Asp) domain-containing protein
MHILGQFDETQLELWIDVNEAQRTRRARATSWIQKNLVSLQPKVLVPVVVISVALAMMVPHKSVGTGSYPAQIFSTDNVHQASVLYTSASENDPPVLWNTNIMVTSYNSVPWQTDSTPFITASGTRTRDGVLATNYLPIGTQVRFPDLYGNKIFIVEDRMNARYFKRADIWAEDIQFSRNFGARYLRMEVLTKV